MENQQQETKEIYEKPMIEVIEMEMESNILAGSDFNPGGGNPWS